MLAAALDNLNTDEFYSLLAIRWRSLAMVQCFSGLWRCKFKSTFSYSKFFRCWCYWVYVIELGSSTELFYWKKRMTLWSSAHCIGREAYVVCVHESPNIYPNEFLGGAILPNSCCNWLEMMITFMIRWKSLYCILLKKCFFICKANGDDDPNPS